MTPGPAPALYRLPGFHEPPLTHGLSMSALSLLGINPWAARCAPWMRAAPQTGTGAGPG